MVHVCGMIKLNRQKADRILHACSTFALSRGNYFVVGRLNLDARFVVAAVLMWIAFQCVVYVLFWGMVFVLAAFWLYWRPPRFLLRNGHQSRTLALPARGPLPEPSHLVDDSDGHDQS